MTPAPAGRRLMGNLPITRSRRNRGRHNSRTPQNPDAQATTAQAEATIQATEQASGQAHAWEQEAVRQGRSHSLDRDRLSRVVAEIFPCGIQKTGF